MQPFLTRDHLSAISGVTPTANLYAQVRSGALNNSDVTLFVQHLLEEIGCPLWLIWDGGSIHHGEDLDRFLLQVGPDQVLLECLPSYAPELNPAEGVWNFLKYAELPNVCCFSLRKLRWHLDRALMRLRTKPDKILSFFEGAGLSLE